MNLTRTASWAFAAAFLALPLSKSATLVFAGIACLLTIASGAVLEDLRARRLPPWIVPLAVLAALPFSSPWIHDGDGTHVEIGYHWLVALAVFAAAGRARIGQWLVAFLIGTSIAFVHAQAAGLGLPTLPWRPAALGNYILYSQFLVTGVLVAALLHRFGEGRVARAACLAAIAAFVYGLATGAGRTGVLALIALLPLVASLLLPRRGVAVVLVGCAVGTALLLASPTVRERIGHAANDLAQVRDASGRNPMILPDGRENSIGYRFEMWRVAGELFGAHPIAGAGPAAFQRAWLARHEGDGARFVEPHNTYLFHAAAYGLLGVASLVALWAIAIADGWRRRDGMAGALALGFGIVCVVAGFSNTLVLGTTSAMMVVLFLGMGGATRPAPGGPPAAKPHVARPGAGG